MTAESETGEMKTAIGLMSGTSMDGIDAALIRTDGRLRVETGAWLTRPYEPAFRDRLRAVLGQRGDVAGLGRDLTDQHADAVRALIEAVGIAPAEVDVIGFHGQTILHMPEQRLTVQIGDGQRLADMTGIAVVNDFRAADVLAGGQGAPFAPLYHAALAGGVEKPVAVLNLGGVGNVTWIGRDGQILAFDTGPGNALIDDWILERTGNPVDLDGQIAAVGQVHEPLLALLMDQPYFARTPPKSLDRGAFGRSQIATLSTSDGAATLVAFTARSVARALDHLPEAPIRWLVTGGGRRNPTLMAALRREVGAAVEAVEEVGWQGDSLEAQAFAYLAVRSQAGLPLSLPTTTGVPEPMPGGRFWQPKAA